MSLSLFPGITLDTSFVSKHWWLCQMIGLSSVSARILPLLSLFAVTLNRYIYICHGRIYDKVFSRTKNAIMCVFIWILGVIMEMPHFLTAGIQNQQSEKNHTCLMERIKDMHSMFALSTSLLVCHVLGMVTCYLLIFRHLKSSHRRLTAHQGPLSHKTSGGHIRDSISSAKSLTLVFVTFLVCWMPYTLVKLAETRFTVPMFLHMYSTLLAHSHSSIGAVIYYCTNGNFRSKVHLLGDSSTMKPPFRRTVVVLDLPVRAATTLSVGISMRIYS